MMVACGENVRAGHPLLEDKRAVRNHDTGFGETSAVAGKRRAVNRAGTRVRQESGQIGRRPCEPNDDRAIIGGLDSQRLDRFLAGDDVVRVRDDVDDLGVLRGGRRINKAAQGREEICGNHPIAI